MTAPSIDERRQPGLSETLGILIDPRMCRGCGGTRELRRWRECDPFDRPTMVVVVLCKFCSRKLIDRHPRLYIELAPHEPFPGVMQICVDCPRRNGVSCTSPLAKHNGGTGMRMEGPRPTVAFIDCTPRSKSGMVKLYTAEATGCAGKQESLRPQLVE
jgi:hypothetical protein